MFWRRSRSPKYDSPEKAEVPRDETPRPFPFAYPSPQGTAEQTASLPVSQMQAVPVTSIVSAKMREYTRHANQYSQSTPSSAYTSSTDPSSSRVPPTVVSDSSQTGSGSSPLSPQDVQGLRSEVENLRRVMESIQNERLEPPPSYA